MKTFDKVLDLLKRYQQARDNDNLLMCLIWFKEIPNIDNLTARELLKIISDNKLTAPESITRCRRKIQEDDESLRGKKYEQRKGYNYLKLFE